MSLNSFIKKVCVQPAVYFGNPVDDGYGQKKLNPPVEILVRWDDKQNIAMGDDGNEFLSRATVMSPVEQPLDLHGFLFLGTLEDFYEAYADLIEPIEQCACVAPVNEALEQVLRTGSTDIIFSECECPTIDTINRALESVLFPI